MISGGLNVYPREVEIAIDSLPEVAESAVIGAPHPDLGEAVVAVVVPAPGAHAGGSRYHHGIEGSVWQDTRCPKRVFVVRGSAPQFHG